MKIEWEDWSGASAVEIKHRDEFARDALDKVVAGKAVCDIVYGDTAVIAIRFGDTVRIYDCVLRREAEVVLERDRT